jgi:hypothetical protein
MDFGRGSELEDVTVHRMTLMVPLAALAACGSTAVPTGGVAVVQRYTALGSALDAATRTWTDRVSALVTAGTDSVANETPFDSAYSQALQAFGTGLLGVQFPTSAQSDASALVTAVTAVRTDLTAIVAGSGSASQFVGDEKKFQAAINVLQTDLGLGTSTPIPKPT